MIAHTSDRGSGVLSTTLGVGVFLILLYFAAYVLLNLWLTSSVDAAAQDAAVDVATADPTTSSRQAAEAEAITRARTALGEYGSKVSFAFDPQSPAGGGDVVLHVRAPQLKLAPPMVAAVFDLGGYDRTIVVHPETR